MQTNLRNSAGVWNSEQGAFISEAHERLATILHDYNPNFSLAWIPPKNRNITDTKPFAIFDSTPGMPPYIMRYLTEQEMLNPTEVLAWIFDGDMSKHRSIDILTKLQNRENAQRLMEMRARDDEAEDMQEHVAFLASGGRNKLNYVHENGRTLSR